MRANHWMVASMLSVCVGLAAGALAQPQPPTENQTPVLQMAAIAPFVPSNTVDTVLGPVDSKLYTVINDVYFEADTLTLLMANQPMAVKKAFLLPSPDRYVVDIDHAVLGTKELARIVTQNHPDIQSIKVGQFDDKTVRLVILLTPSTQPLDILQKESPKSLRLIFSSKPVSSPVQVSATK